MIKIRIGNPIVEFEGVVNGIKGDLNWDGRDTKTITVKADYATVSALFVNDVEWNIVETIKISVPKTNEDGKLVYDEFGNPIIDVIEQENVYCNNDYCVAGDIIDHRDGHISIKMGKLTDLENAYMMIYGGI